MHIYAAEFIAFRSLRIFSLNPIRNRTAATLGASEPAPARGGAHAARRASGGGGASRGVQRACQRAQRRACTGAQRVMPTEVSRRKSRCTRVLLIWAHVLRHTGCVVRCAAMPVNKCRIVDTNSTVTLGVSSVSAPTICRLEQRRKAFM